MLKHAKMTKIKQYFTQKGLFSSLAQLFFQGVILLAPIGVTVWVVVSLFNWVDNFLPNVLNLLFPQQFAAVNGQIPKVTGLGFIVAITLVLVVGWLSNLFVVEKLMNIFDKILEKTPGVKIIYSSVKDFLEAFAGNKKKFDQPVLVNVDAPDVWRMGFITQESTELFGMKEYLTVYVPHSYAISGITYVVPLSKIRRLPKGVGASEAMKYVVTGGLTAFDEQLDLFDEATLEEIKKPGLSNPHNNI
jgi:uncharacterized membrane protein